MPLDIVNGDATLVSIHFHSHKMLASAGSCVPASLTSFSLQTYCKGYTLALVKEKTLRKQLLSIKAKTSWSWERMCRELHRVMGEEGPTHTTLFRYATGKVKRPNVLTEQYVREAIQKVTVELSQK